MLDEELELDNIKGVVDGAGGAGTDGMLVDVTAFFASRYCAKSWNILADTSSSVSVEIGAVDDGSAEGTIVVTRGLLGFGASDVGGTAGMIGRGGGVKEAAGPAGGRRAISQQAPTIRQADETATICH